MGIFPEGNSYGIPENIIFSCPTIIDKDGNWKLVNDQKLTDKMKKKLEENSAEISEQVNIAMEVVNKD